MLGRLYGRISDVSASASCTDFVREYVGRRRYLYTTTANRILVSGIENTGLARGPVFQLFDGNGNLLLSRFVLNRDFTDLQVFAATTNSVTGEMTVVGDLERTI